MKVGNLMDTAVVTLRRDSTLAEIYAVINQNGQTDFPVIDENAQLVGMLYEENIHNALKKTFQKTQIRLTEFMAAARCTARLLNLRAEEIMTPDIGWVSTETHIGNVAAVMEDKKVCCLPVLGDGRVQGIISERAIFMALLKQGLALKNTPESIQADPKIKEKPIAEKRRHFRKPASFKLAYKPVSFRLDYNTTDVYGNPIIQQQARIARCLNLSVGGMLIHASEASQENDVLDLAFEIPFSGDAIRRLARVTRSVLASPRGFSLGLVFLALSVQETAALANYLKTLPD